MGPYKEHCARTEVEEGPLSSNTLNRAVDACRKKGFKVIFRLNKINPKLKTRKAICIIILKIYYFCFGFGII